ncbi:hypothetical protein [Bombilactobacillus thymidiniphilus]|uniref:Uncharacterized protein n=1 Tax=Bombilactobacillus thymidiniphilus TaxID=2923363 RepID=A0ABY4PFC1_9LACO|nr:hypothetical protein [Bombilactobacillus thymidiniphilus]UQS84302.1 hypothetical protein MOO47_03900 [Bombilactobacillus thymidiniphilus]
MFNLTFKQSEKITKDLINNFVVNLKGKKHVTFGYTFKHFFANSFFNFWILFLLFISFVVKNKKLELVLKLGNLLFFFVLCLWILSIFSYIILYFTKSVLWDEIFSFGMLYNNFVIIILLIPAMMIGLAALSRGLMVWLIYIFYIFIIIWTFINIYHSYSVFKKNIRC